MLKKIEKKRVSGSELRVDKFVELASKKQMIKFLRDIKMKLSDAYKMVDEGETKVENSKIKQSLNTIDKRKLDIAKIDAPNPGDAEQLYHMLFQLSKEIKDKKMEIENYLSK
jgi:hypothetical protein